MTRDEEIAELDTRLRKAQNDISAWCQRMAWPGKAPTPPYQAWEDRKNCVTRLRELGEKRSMRFVHDPKASNRGPGES